MKGGREEGVGCLAEGGLDVRAFDHMLVAWTMVMMIDAKNFHGMIVAGQWQVTFF